MGFPDDDKENINGAECERIKVRMHLKAIVNATRNAIVSERCACNDAVFLRVKRKSFSRTIQSNLHEVCSFCDIGDR